MFNETPEYLKQEEENYAECLAKIHHKYGGKDCGFFGEMNCDDSNGDLEAIIQYMVNKNGEPTETMEPTQENHVFAHAKIIKRAALMFV